jgi:hypothetical protein
MPTHVFTTEKLFKNTVSPTEMFSEIFSLFSNQVNSMESLDDPGASDSIEQLSYALNSKPVPAGKPLFLGVTLV